MLRGERRRGQARVACPARQVCATGLSYSKKPIARIRRLLAGKERILTKRCAICDESLTEENNHREHVIPEALGGRRAIKDFLCRSCNNRTGSEWDAPLIEALHQLAVLIGSAKKPTLFEGARYEGNLPSGREVPEEFREENLERIKRSPQGKTENSRLSLLTREGFSGRQNSYHLPAVKAQKGIAEIAQEVSSG